MDATISGHPLRRRKQPSNEAKTTWIPDIKPPTGGNTESMQTHSIAFFTPEGVHYSLVLGLVALLGTTGDVKEFDVGPNTGVSSRVQAVCDFFGPTDFTKMSSFPSTMKHDAPDSPESKLIGGPI